MDNIAQAVSQVNRLSGAPVNNNCDMGNLNTLAQRLRSSRVSLGMTQLALAKRSGLSQTTISDIERGRNAGSREILSLARELGVSALWLAEGKGDPNAVSIVMSADMPAVTGSVAISEGRSHDSVLVPVFDARASAGTGELLTEHDTVVGGITLTRSWVEGQLRGVTSPRHLAVLSAYGDSMSPTFSDGDLLLLDTGVTEVRVDAVFVFVFQGEMYVKRLQRNLDGTLLMISDNQNFRPQMIDRSHDGFRILGRVVWAWNGRKL